MQGTGSSGYREREMVTTAQRDDFAEYLAFPTVF